MNDHTKITLFLKEILEEHNSSLQNPYPIAWPTIPYYPDDNKPYIRIGRSFGDVIRPLLSSFTGTHSGSWIVSLVYPVGSPIEMYDNEAAELAKIFLDKNHFRGLCLNITNISIKEGYLDNGWWTTPIIVTWECNFK